MSNDPDRLLKHDYDGIQEMDNDLPRWWVWLFVICVVWGVLYFLYFHVFGIGYLSSDEYKSEIDPAYTRPVSADSRIFGILPEYHSPLFAPERDQEMLSRSAKERKTTSLLLTHESDTTTYFALAEQADLDAGKAIFQQNCFTCHGMQGQGGIGPNLTDDYWLHGAGMTNMTKTIRYGYPTKGMLAWLGTLSPKQILQVASYVRTLHGTNPPNPKPPQGDLAKE
jgi:cytochrome c oxidase cbb3-type subunit III